MASTNKAKNKVKYGVEHLTIYPKKADGTYDTGFTIPGTVSLNMDPQGSSNPFYADNANFFNSISNTGWSGDIVTANLPDEFYVKCLGWVLDANGALVEVSDAVPPHFGMSFEIIGDQAKRRPVYYDCTATRPADAAQTVEDSATPQTDTVTVTAVPVKFEGADGEEISCARAVFQKDTCPEAAWGTFWTTIVEPTFTTGA